MEYILVTMQGRQKTVRVWGRGLRPRLRNPVNLIKPSGFAPNGDCS